ncbi:hypothetical protein BU24DRAFT_450973 [Aaosphaeria arxii CBS 175.79]|uniref:HD/PDEase domain-containing protein n=1 Tax=Aaosphaeria arxii CBS 175.79 TaxID=1450172 RepID=A0A6A5XUH0_9PLEO|nr:uncharacterized protein BU24DRAFT_450973 [Aaosphaeria arxii CBS 175.79]KAF2016457.1 hypothetical protein BU24DRAFT_450973 [Aaosphaeria arxii CBS 175.79]
MATPSSIPYPVVPIKEEDADLFKSVVKYVHEYMSQPGHDNSHDFLHILRVVSNANRILEAELKANPAQKYDTSALFLAALLHDVGDRKYAKPGEDVEQQISRVLVELGAPEHLALKVQAIAKHVSYSVETKKPEAVKEVLLEHPELAIVQDSDRLDAIGAIGVGRAFSYGAAKCPDKPMSRAVDHFTEKLFKLEGMMKTTTGRELAQARHKILEDFAVQFRQESELTITLQ